MIHYGNSHPSIGLLLGVPAFLLVILGCIGVSVYAWRHEFDSYDKRLAQALFIGGISGAVITLIIAVLGFWPWQGEYHHWQNVSGTVTSTNSRFLAKSNGTDQKFVVTFQGSPKQFGCNDSRCASVRKGDELTITCKRVWQWFGTPGYDCNFVTMQSRQ